MLLESTGFEPFRQASTGGPLALVEDGHIIHIDVLARTIDLVIPVEELNRRADAWVPPPLPLTKRHGVLAKYARNV